MSPNSNQKSVTVSGIIWVLVLSLMCLPWLGNLYFAPLVLAASNDRSLVQQGIDLYNQGEYERARQTFESAEIVNSENIAIPYYLGLIYLEQNNRPAAIAEWKKYVAVAPQDENTRTIRKNITLLLRKEAKAYAKKAVAEEASLLKGPVDYNAVAVAPFKNMGSQDLGPLGKGMAAMVIADLSTFKDLKVVERERLQALLDEMELGTSGLVDQKSAPKVGKLLKAKYVTSGSLADLEKESLQVASVLQDADLNTTVGTKEVDGRLAKFYELEKEIACDIVTQLGRDCKQAPAVFGKIHTKSLPALVAYSNGLDYLDDDKLDEARLMFKQAVEEDPDFDLAQAALLATPVTAMLFLTESQMISSASASAPSSAATASSTAAATTAGTGGGLSLGTTVAIAGGVAVAGGAAAAYANLTDDETDTGVPDIEGQWGGNWTDDAGGSGTLSLTLERDGNSLIGNITINGSDCISSGEVTGSFDGSDITLDVTSSDASAQLDARLNQSSETLEGTLEITSGECEGNTLTISTSKTETGGARVGW